jgi:hypothetical protein
VAALSRECGPPALRPDEVPDGQRFNATGGGPLHGPVSLPHIPVRTDDTPRKAVYLVPNTGMANARVPPLAPSRNGSPGPSSPPTLAGAFHVEYFGVQSSPRIRRCRTPASSRDQAATPGLSLIAFARWLPFCWTRSAQ